MTDRKDNPSAAARIRVMKRDKFTCTYCGVPGTEAELEVDHIHAVANGGSHHISNLTTSCRACNQDKGTKTLKPNGHKRHEASAHPLVGLYLHTLNAKDCIEFQGHILAVDGETVLVQLFEWFMGEATEIRKFAKDLIYSDRCILYPDAETWKFQCEKRQKREERAERSAAQNKPESP